MTQSDREDQRARILRYGAVRTRRASNQEVADRCLHPLQAMAASSRSVIIQQSYHGAAGALLMASQKYTEAIPHLEEDRDKILWNCCRRPTLKPMPLTRCTKSRPISAATISLPCNRADRAGGSCPAARKPLMTIAQTSCKS